MASVIVRSGGLRYNRHGRIIRVICWLSMKEYVVGTRPFSCRGCSGESYVHDIRPDLYLGLPVTWRPAAKPYLLGKVNEYS